MWSANALTERLHLKWPIGPAPPTADGRCGFGQRFFAGKRGKRQVAPKAEFANRSCGKTERSRRLCGRVLRRLQSSDDLPAAPINQQLDGFGRSTVRANQGRSFTPAAVPRSAIRSHTQPCRLDETIPLKYAPILQP